jgi:lipoprotein NlpI
MRPQFNTAIDERAKTLFDLGRYGEAAPDFVRDIHLTPGDPRPILWLHVDRLRAHTPDADEFAANIKTLNLTGWPAPLFYLFLGKATLDTIEVASAQSPEGDVEGECEVAVFVGEFHLTRGETDDAIQSFKEAASVCDHTQNRYLTAWAELKRLDPTLSAAGPW